MSACVDDDRIDSLMKRYILRILHNTPAQYTQLTYIHFVLANIFTTKEHEKDAGDGGRDEVGEGGNAHSVSL